VFDEECVGDPSNGGEPTNSIHALIGIQPRTGRTMHIHVHIAGTLLVALLDMRSTHNFIDTDAATRAGLALLGSSGLRVAVANGDRVTSPGCCRNLSMPIGNKQFIIDCYGLSIGSYDMVLGVQWLKSLGPVLWDFASRTIAFMRNGHHVLWTAAGSSTPSPCLVAVSADLMEDLLQSFASLFDTPTGLPPPRDRQHHIRLIPGTALVAVRPYRYAHLQEELERQCAVMLTHGVIRPSSSAFFAPVLLVKKADDSWRFCVDYRTLNAKTVKDKFLIPIVEELLDELRDASFTKLDLRSGYHQVLMHPDDVEMAAFRTHQGLFEFLVMPFGLTNALAMFQALMNDVLRPFLRRFVLVFFDDILIYSSVWSEHLHLVFEQLQAHKLYLKKSKCFFSARSVAYLDHVISDDGVAMDGEKVQDVLSWPPPTTVRAVRAFLGLVGYYRRFIKDYGATAAPLTQLLRKDSFRWSAKAVAAFQAFQRALTTAPVLRLLAFDSEFVVECDASGSGIGTVLHQGDGPIAFFSRPMAPQHAKLEAYERELIGLVHAIRHWQAYL
jgi:hypothetical protein